MCDASSMRPSLLNPVQLNSGVHRTHSRPITRLKSHSSSAHLTFLRYTSRPSQNVASSSNNSNTKTRHRQRFSSKLPFSFCTKLREQKLQLQLIKSSPCTTLLLVFRTPLVSLPLSHLWSQLLSLRPTSWLHGRPMLAYSRRQTLKCMSFSSRI